LVLESFFILIKPRHALSTGPNQSCLPQLLHVSSAQHHLHTKTEFSEFMLSICLRWDKGAGGSRQRTWAVSW